MPSAEITCPVCLETLKSSKPVPAGATVRCPKCRGSFQVGGRPSSPNGPLMVRRVEEPEKPGPRSAPKPEAPKSLPTAEPPRRKRGNNVLMIVGLVLFTLFGFCILCGGTATFFIADYFRSLSPPVVSVSITKPTPSEKPTTKTEPTKPATKPTAKVPTAPIPPMPDIPRPSEESLDPQVRDRVKQATVALHWIMPGDDRETIRTGFLALEPDLILTSAQGIRVDFGAVLPPLVDVVLHPGETEEMLVPATVIAKSADGGLYLLRVQRRDQALKLPLPLPLQSVPAVLVKQTLHVIGCPGNQKSETLAVVPLVVAAITVGTSEAPSQLRLQGTLKETSGGAPVVDAKGNVIGVATLTTKGPTVLGGESLPAIVEAALKKSSPNMADRVKGIAALRMFEGHKGAVFSVSLTRDGKWAASGGADKTIRLWDVETGKPIKTLEGHTDEVHGVALSADGKFVLSGSFDKTVRLWEVATGKQVSQLRPEKVGNVEIMGQVYGVAVSADGRLGVSGDDQSARLWNLGTGEQIHAAMEGHTAVAFAPDGKTALIAGLNGLEVWKTDGKSDPKPIKAESKAWVNGVAFTRDGNRLVSCQVAGEMSRISLWNLQAGRLIRDFEGESSGEFFCVALSPNDRFVVSGDEKGFIRLWDVEKGKEVGRGLGHGGPVKSVAITADGKLILSGSEDGTLRLWPMPK